MNNYIKSALLVIFIIFSTVSCSQGINSLRSLRIGSCKISGIQPYGFTALQADLAVDINNPSKTLEITNILGVVKIDGKEFVTASCDKIVIAAHKDSVYIIPVIGRVGFDFNPFTAISIFYGKDFSRAKVDLSAFVTTQGSKPSKVEVKNVPVTRFLKLQ